ncbi:MAG: RecX family transcriptional regulator, partial [Bacteroidales bacterium]|nr:RecX family transcriptional regulator [Bacteroidales bacterium]
MERNEQDVQKKLKLWEISENESRKIVARLQEEGFISQERYLKSYIRGKFVYNKWGKIKIRYALLQKGFKESVITPILNDFFDTSDYKKIVTNELQKKNKTLRTDDLYERKAKLLQFSQS